jgi:predicted NUDIX family NTP pyrophosphohydrolase
MGYSAGIIPFRRAKSGEIEFFVGHPGGEMWQNRNYWAFLKGGVEGDETWEETALREFKEETGLELDGITKSNLISLGTTRQNKYKIAIAFGLYYPNINPDECHSNYADDGVTLEIDKYAWYTFDELKEITHPTHLDFYKQIIELVS